MADKGKKGKGAAAAPAAPAPTTATPPPSKSKEDNAEEEKEKKPTKSEQPKDEVGTRKGCRRYMWEFKDSNRQFWVMGHAVVKLFSVGCLIAAMIMFTGTSVHPLLTLIVTMEISIFCFFFVVYTLAIQRYLPFILWPVSDLLNDLFATIFLVGAVVFAVKTRQTMPTNYFIAVILIGVAGFFAFIDIFLQRKHFKGKRIRKNVLVPPVKREQVKEKEVTKPKEEGKAALSTGPHLRHPREEGNRGGVTSSAGVRLESKWQVCFPREGSTWLLLTREAAGRRVAVAVSVGGPPLAPTPAPAPLPFKSTSVAPTPPPAGQAG
ncbi:CKLF-like MARVEL transmembrane domain-containing protein 2 [Rousettus aegyptiacus]|uniref:CKLF-like MARVEL transmembrane domain-containing protein 2 n=1 Tax=Rousettus aegyptiacus TaxID=9407 RepID=UPI00168D813F|nr:CKLF-like MARVEL transmembrane domain-containing protein 2 [Rousettus aegyptiacus]